MSHDPCGTCYGTGAIRCNHCGGRGLNRNSNLLNDPCRGCHGTGKEKCQACQGTGEWRTDRATAAHYTEHSADDTIGGEIVNVERRSS